MHASQGTQGTPWATSAWRAVIVALAIGLVVGLAATARAGPVGIPALEPLDGGGADATVTMSVAATEATLTGYMDALIAGDRSYADFLADDVVLTIVGGGEAIVGLAAVTEAIDGMHFVLFNARPELTTIMVGAGQAAFEANFVATHTGEFGGIAATGVAVDPPYSVFCELDDGKITALRVYGLVDGLIQQLNASAGAWAPPPSPRQPGRHPY